MTLLERAERRRVNALEAIGHENLNVNEQFFTPLQVALLMADILLSSKPLPKTLKLLDPGAGSGILTVAAVEKIKESQPNTTIYITAIEKDPKLLKVLSDTYSDLAIKFDGINYEIINDDFLYWATEDATLFTESSKPINFDLIIQNPPYAKLPARGPENRHLQKCGIYAPNVYAAFMALCKKLLVENGVLVSITPRSWMNGTYFTAFRKELFFDSRLSTIHTFESRREVFKDTGVLQEAIITAIVKTKITPRRVTISSSKSQADDIVSRHAPYSAVLVNGIVFVPATEEDVAVVKWMSKAESQLTDLNIKVSTGRVVAFRSRDSLVDHQEPGTVPMIYASNFNKETIKHPVPNLKKPQFYKTRKNDVDKNLVPPGTYVLVKRFSSKEEKRRITAAIWSSDSYTAFDNKTNFFHVGGQGLSPKVARGLCKWLNSRNVDSFFRVFSGHTQVNAGDLRMIPYPRLDQLELIAAVEASSDQSVNTVLS
ncbi:Eco57I restriction-modification methylase domain-containing protein [Corynebacterium pseudodiphtheriticum]|uniref:Eco57I restriction-modification methylase domain-containing protein n=1 Tax=Corynebacterium pseudodiphtheriticum TaxID=37637 RepID=UPI002549DB09|nr:Eco57I restriction-modification methylase domain-containing protein [Corynebacterium pseudodiphtheriticum]MDK8718726.1 Eco57I restriction-modification methylase domain-containing protein [Corynebacterium pseudodiphtheriticum]